jgi:hypothetical protein
MGAMLTSPTPAAAPPSGRGRARLAALERPLLAAGLGLVTLHLLDLAFAGPATSGLGVLAIMAVPLAWGVAQPHVTRATRLALAVPVGLLALGFGVVSHGLHVVNSGAGGAAVELWELPDSGHTAGLRTHPGAYERRTTAFLDRALGLPGDTP